VVVIGVLAIYDDRWQAAVAVLVALLILLVIVIHRFRGARPRTGTPWISGPFLTLLGVFAFLAFYFFPVTDLPAPSGQYPVGVQDFELVDESRKGVIAAGPEEPRRLLVRVWYPADDITGIEARHYFEGAEVDSTAVALGRFINAEFAFKYLKHSKTNSYPAAPLHGGFKGLPVVIYSHGYTSFAGQNTALMEELASHGYAVYSIQHTYDSAPTVFPNGDVVDSDPQLMVDMMAEVAKPSEAMTRGFIGSTLQERREGQIQAHTEAIAANQRLAARSTRIWTDDRKFVLDQLEAEAVPESVKEIVAASDFLRTGQMGMSFGGSTTGEVCMLDPRCAAGVNLDGGDFHFSPFGQNIPVPFLMFYSDFRQIAAAFGGDKDAPGHGFNDFSYERPETAGLRDDMVRLMVNRVTHLGVSDFSLFMRTPLRNPLFGSIDSAAIIQIQNDFVRGFFDTWVRGVKTDFPAAQFSAHSDWVDRDSTTPVREWWLSEHPEDQTIRVMLETSEGNIEVALYPQRAPLSVAHFLSYVDGGHYDGATFYRVTRKSETMPHAVVQGGLSAADIVTSLEDYSNQGELFPPVAHETTDTTGIPNETGTLAYARLEPGTANSEFFFNLGDNPVLDTGNTSRNPDGQGYATFGRVLRGMRVLEKIQSLPADGATEVEYVKGQILSQPVQILRVYRVE